MMSAPPDGAPLAAASAPPASPAPQPAAGPGAAVDGGPAVVPSLPRAAAAPPIPAHAFAERRREALRRIALEQAAPVATALGLTYVLLAGAHLQLVAPAHRVALSAAAAASALGAGLIRLAIARIPATLLPRAPDLLGLLLLIGL
ncbi:MAG: hypothetical protein RL071_3566, partial [Pseudomonadota bacterium]